MSFHHLQQFLSLLEEKGDLARIKVPVDPRLEITEIAMRTVQNNGPALLFEQVQGASFPLVMNLFGARRRIEWALGASAGDIGLEAARFLMNIPPRRFSQWWDSRALLKRLASMGPKMVSRPSVMRKKIEPVDLGRLPILQSWPDDAGRFLTFPLVLTKSPLTGRQNLGVYRMQVFSKNETGMHWQIAKGGGLHFKEAEEKGESFHALAVLGADPLLMMCGVLPLPEGADEILFSGFLRRERTRVSSHTASGMNFPAEAEFILEGHVPFKESRMEGPFGDHFGHYSAAAPYPVFKISRIWHRENPVFPASVVGKPPQEDKYLGEASQELLLPLIRILRPEIVDMWAYWEAGFHNLLVISVKERYEKEAVKTGLWALGEGQLALTKCVILVDGHVNPRDFKSVLNSLRENFDPADDFVLLPHTIQDTLDFTGPKMNLGSKMILDATSGSSSQDKTGLGHDGRFIQDRDPRIVDTRLLADTFLVIKVQGQGRQVLEKVRPYLESSRLKLVAAVSQDVPLDDEALLLWGIFTRFDCERDTFFSSVVLKAGHPRYGGPLFIDATHKSGYPAPLSMPEEVIKLVDRRWKEYGINCKSSG